MLEWLCEKQSVSTWFLIVTGAVCGNWLYFVLRWFGRRTWRP